MKGIKWFTALISPDILKIRLSLTFQAPGMRSFDSGKNLKQMTPRMNDNLVKAFFFMIILIVLLFQSLFTQAERPKNIHATFVDTFPSPDSQIRNCK